MFEISVDTLLGYDRQNEKIEKRMERINQFVMEKDFNEAVLEAEKALKKYPNNFDVVYTAAKVYMFRFSQDKEENSMLRSNELFHNAIMLLYQNKNRSINEVTILNLVGQNYIAAGQMEKGIDILEQNNFCDINSARIGFSYAIMKQSDKAQLYLQRAYLNMINYTLHTMAGMIFMYAQQKNELCIDTALWLVEYFDSIKEEGDRIIFIDKLKAILFAQLALMLADNERYDEAERYIIDAYNLAIKFDATPIYTTQGMVFFKDEEIGISLDGLGETAIDGIEGFVFGNASPSKALTFVKCKFEELKR